jgi:hypothetical protein
MRSIFRNAVLGLAVAAANSAAHAQVVVTEPGGTVIEPLQLTPTQRTVIYRTIVHQRTIPAPSIEYRIGARVPEAIALEPLPDTVVAEVPAIRSYRYVVANNRVILVDPATGVVVGEAYE